MAVFITVMIIVAALAGFGIWVMVASRKLATAGPTDDDIAYQEKLTRHQSAQADFIANDLQDPEAKRLKLDGKYGFLSVKAGRSELRVVQISSSVEKFELTIDRTIPFSDIRTVEFVQDDKRETYRRAVTTPVALAKNKSAIGRGLAGGVLLGPAGLLLGAASALTPETKIVEHKSSELAERTVKGPPMLVITTRDRENPFIRLQFDDVDEARSYALWIGDLLPPES